MNALPLRIYFRGTHVLLDLGCHESHFAFTRIHLLVLHRSELSDPFDTLLKWVDVVK